jgi:putative FmdB family regulatory protein
VPIYTYECEHCKSSQEEMFSLKSRPEFITCNTCGKNARYVLSPTQFEVNGANAANRYSGDSNFYIPGERRK